MYKYITHTHNIHTNTCAQTHIIHKQIHPETDTHTPHDQIIFSNSGSVTVVKQFEGQTIPKRGKGRKKQKQKCDQKMVSGYDFYVYEQLVKIMVRMSSQVILIIKVFIKHRILSIETMLSAYTHACAHTQTHQHSDYTKLNLHSLNNKQQRDLR